MRYLILLIIIFITPGLRSTESYAQQTGAAAIKGVVTDEKGEPLPGVNLFVKSDPKTGTTTDRDGNFSIRAKRGDVIVFSYIGFTSNEVTVGDPAAVVRVKLQQNDLQLNEVVVVGYGQVKRRDLTGSVASIKAADMVKSTDMSLNGTLQGRAAGVSVVSNEGAPGAEVSVYVRAGSSISAGNEPLYVIDGFPSLGGSNLNINVNDVESVEVLKDASATAIYGSRGANGVIIITTKSGKEGKFNVNYDPYYSSQKIAVMRDVLNTAQYAEKQHYLSASPRNSETNDSLWHNWQSYRDSVSTNWQNEVYQVAPMQSHNLSFTGGLDRLKVAGSINVTDQDGIARGTNYKRYSGRISTIANITNKVSNSTIINLTHQDRTGPSLTGGGGLAFSTVKASPFRPPGVDLNEYLFASGLPVGGTNGRDPLVDLLESDVKNLNYFASLNTAFSFKLLEGLTLKISGGMNYTTAAYNYFYGVNTSQGAQNNGVAVKNNSVYVGLLNENTLSYTRSFGKNHSLDAVAGFSTQTNTSTFTNAGSRTFAIEALGYDNLSFGSVFSSPTSGKTKSGIESYFGRINYSLLNKYLFTGTMRADGSSKFPNNKWGYFPSAAFAWKVKEEKFMRDITAISSLKFRSSWGMTGNESIAPYSSYTSYGSITPRAVMFETPVVGVYPNQLGSPQLKWETTIASNLAVDLGILKDRIMFTAEAYRKTSKDLLLRAPLSNYSGFTSVTRNVGDMEVKGLEFDLNTVNINKKFKWNTNFNISFNKTKVLSLNENQQFFYTGTVNRYSNAYIVQVGQSLGSIFGFVYDGLINTTEELAATTPHTTIPIKVGTRKYKDISGPKGVPDGVVDLNDRTVVGNGNPKFFGGFSNDFSYGGFDLSVLFTYNFGNDILNADKVLNETPYSYQGGLTTMLDRWTPDNPQINRQRWDTAYSGEYSNLSSYLIENGSYVRLKNIQLAYTFKPSMLQRLPFKSVRAYVTAQNLLTFTHYTGYDPEVNYLNSIITPGADAGAYPRSRVYTFGLNIAL